MEIVPSDIHLIPEPKQGQRVTIYGVWVRDEGHFLFSWGWNEIHPARHVKILDSGAEGGNLPFEGEIFEGVDDSSRLKVIDPINPYRTVSGVVKDVFKNFDGDLHIHILPDREYAGLVRAPPPMIYVPVSALRLGIIPVASLTIPYLVSSLVHPRRTWLGRKLILVLRVLKVD